MPSPSKLRPPRSFVALFLGSVLLALGCRQSEQIQTYPVPKEPKTAPVADTKSTPPGEPTDRMLAAILPADGQAWFFKVVGPIAEIDKREKEINDFFSGVDLSDDGKPKWKLPDGWKEEPGNQFRLATIVPAGDKRLEITVGAATWQDTKESLLPNVNRWRGQLQLPEIGPKELDEVTREAKAGDRTITIVDMRGHFSGGMTPPFARGGFAPPISSDQSSSGLPAGHPPIDAADSAKAAPPRLAAPSDVPKFTPPPSWKELPAAGLKKAEFVLSEEQKEARVTLIDFHTTEGSLIGDPLANINRWRGEIGLNPIDQAALAGATETVEVDGRPVTVAAMIPDPAKPEESKANEATIAAIVKNGDTLWFVKMRGDRELVNKRQDEFKTFLNSLKFSSGGAKGDGNN
jgi:hypothetical protein